MEEEKKTSEVSEAEFPENFPTSAKPVFQGVVVLLLSVVVLCFFAYRCSEDTEGGKRQIKIEKKEGVKKNLLAEDEDEEAP